MTIPSASPINPLNAVISSFFHLPSCSSWSHNGKKLSTYSGNCRNGERLFTIQMIPPVMRYKTINSEIKDTKHIKETFLTIDFEWFQ